MSAVRVARAATKRAKLIKFEGCYHGHADAFLVQAGSGALTLGVPTSPGVTEGAAGDTVIASYNDLQSVERALSANRSSVAAVIVEPIAGNMGLVPPAVACADCVSSAMQQVPSHLRRESLQGFAYRRAGAAIAMVADLLASGRSSAGFRWARGGRADLMELVSAGRCISGRSRAIRWR
jgi:glutamate-1-semialdehyde 2,1-aminomutase